MTLVLLIAATTLLYGCASSDLDKKLSEVNSRPYLSDTVELQTFIPVKVSPLTKVDGSPQSLLLRHEQHKLDRKTIGAMNKALYYSHLQAKSLKSLSKNLEVEGRARERTTLILQQELKDAEKRSTLNEIKHSVFELLLTALFLFK